MANEAAKEKKKLSPLVIVLLVLVLLAAGFGYCAYSGVINVKGMFTPAPAPAIQMSKKPIFHPLGKFVISIPGDDVQHYMMLELALVSHDPRMPKESDDLQPVIRNALMQYFSDRQYEDVRKEIQDIEKLQTALKKQLETSVKRFGYELALDQVLLTKVVIQ
ncbi:flagellar basal body-associated FliL family protein [Gallaecimonas mangrovi]|uniref:flagellar basal body-associated FliL family protein n=1 Tax=Gallaecimonas mangrovi TaxID=2291597 RepID=UPI000E1FE80A|nr:flagellar basal body-associated FliL family protein [Gallaecimonas mangrovi]